MFSSCGEILFGNVFGYVLNVPLKCLLVVFRCVK
jgi:hypothetical protein